MHYLFVYFWLFITKFLLSQLDPILWFIYSRQFPCFGTATWKLPWLLNKGHILTFPLFWDTTRLVVYIKFLYNLYSGIINKELLLSHLLRDCLLSNPPAPPPPTHVLNRHQAWCKQNKMKNTHSFYIVFQVLKVLINICKMQPAVLLFPTVLV